MSATKDQVHRFLFDNSDIRGEIVTLEKSFQDATSAQGLPSALLPLYGEFMAAVALIAEMLKFDGTITLQARGDGALPVIMAESNQKGHLRGYAQVADPTALQCNDSKDLLPLAALLGNGILSLTMDPAQGQRYQGIVPLDGADLASCLEHYFTQSEQLPTYFKLFASEHSAGGIFLQALPAQLVTDASSRSEQWQTLLQLAATTKAEEIFELDHPTLLYRLFHEHDCRVFEAKDLLFRCHCSSERSLRAIETLGSNEVQAIIDDQGYIDMGCQFCGKNYHFDKTTLKKIHDKLSQKH
ncbi:Hsp33 family molecular chaperone HslO [Agaribacterium haliotis]|uniref:Hsp33 family molecular chaperone HslO n=1 Tax=Agaribacterium haliotis TaxID=2013869 RepID=UPI000BB56BA2|nr:Hsp33 family molecular chaperone HslO [Agaribacterium haliotis]